MDYEKLADFYYEAYEAEKSKGDEADAYLVSYLSDMYLFHEGKSKRYTKEYGKEDA